MSRILREVHETASDLHEGGYIDAVTMRTFDALCLPPVASYAAEDVRRIRARSGLSQAVFARHLNVRPLTVAAWEQGTKKPAGTAAKLLDLIDRKGVDILR